MARLGAPIALPEFSFRDNLQDSPHIKAFDALTAEDAAARDRGEIVGRLLRFPVADSYAVYRITSAKPLTLAHVDYMDGWTITAAHLRGINLASVKEDLRRRDAMDAFFAQRKAERAHS
jgi:hypothetical protein